VAKKKSFADKVRKAAERQAKPTVEYVKWVKAYRAENGAWKFRTLNIAVTDENKKEIYG
jgi:hypothetical protein